MNENNQEPEKEENTERGIEERIPGYYKKGGVWYAIVYGPGPDIPLMNIGPGPDPDPRPIGPTPGEYGPTKQPLINESPRPSIAELVAQLEEQLKKKKNGKNP